MFSLLPAGGERTREEQEETLVCLLIENLMPHKPAHQLQQDDTSVRSSEHIVSTYSVTVRGGRQFSINGAEKETVQ